MPPPAHFVKQKRGKKIVLTKKTQRKYVSYCKKGACHKIGFWRGQILSGSVKVNLTSFKKNNPH
jgi:hypothetical protein